MKKKSIIMFVAVSMLAFIGCTSIPAGLGPLKVVDKVDAQRYLGRWYEVARFPHSFEQNLVGTTAEYALRQDGKIDVRNSGFEKTLDGAYSEVTAVARIPDASESGRLKVTFFGIFDSDYLIFGLDEKDYAWALVGSDTRSFLWFLSRTPQVDDALFEKMKQIAAGQGYDVSKLQKVPQKPR